MVGEIKIEKIRKEFEGNDGEKVIALSEVNELIKANSFTTILGASGCGKTTLLRLISGLDTPTNGTIYLDGNKIDGTSPEIGFVFQMPKLFPWLTVYENIAFGLKANKEFSKNKDKVTKYIKIIGLDGFEKAYPHHLSGGMQQRAALARALINEPKVLLLDEPLGALDALTRVDMQDELLRIWQEENTTMVMVTHDVDEALFLSQKIILMSPKASKVIKSIDLEEEYPRIRNSEKFNSLKDEILELLKEYS